MAVSREQNDHPLVPRRDRCSPVPSEIAESALMTCLEMHPRKAQDWLFLCE
jgi:hypothetical protein